MKKWMICLGALAVLASCARMEEPENLLEANPGNEIVECAGTPLRLNLSITHGVDTRAVNTEWSVGDQVFVFFPQSVADKCKYLMLCYLDMQDGTFGWENNDYFNPNPVTAEDLPSSGKMTAVFLPFGKGTTASWDADGNRYVFSGTDYAYYMSAENADFTVEDDVLSGTLNLCVPEGFVHIYLPESSYYILRQDYITPVGVASIGADGTVTETSDMQPGDPLEGYLYTTYDESGAISNSGTVFSGRLDEAAQGAPKHYWFTLGDVFGEKNYALFRMDKTLGSLSSLKLPALSGWTEIGPDKWVKLRNGREIETVNSGADYPWEYGGLYNIYSTKNSDQGSMNGNDMEHLMDTDLFYNWTWMSVHGVNGYVVSDIVNPSTFFFLPAAGYSSDYGNHVGLEGRYMGVKYSTGFSAHEEILYLAFNSDGPWRSSRLLNYEYNQHDTGNWSIRHMRSSIEYRLSFRFGPRTLGLKAGWSAGDVIYVFFSGAAAPKHLKVRYDGRNWKAVEYDGAKPASWPILSNDESGMMRAIYLPFGSYLTVFADGTDFVFSEEQYSWYMTAELPYNVGADNMLWGTFDMEVPDGFAEFFLEDTDPVSGSCALRCDAVWPVGIASVGANGTVNEDIRRAMAMPGYAIDYGAGRKGYLFSGMIPEYYNSYYALTHYDGCYFALENTEKNTRHDYFVPHLRIDSCDSMRMPGLGESGMEIGGGWQEVGSNKTVELKKSDGTSLGRWYTCNVGCSVPEGTKYYYPFSMANSYATLPQIAHYTALNDNCEWTWTSINGQEGMAVSARFGFLFFPMDATGDRTLPTCYWTSEVSVGQGVYMYFYYGLERCYMAVHSQSTRLMARAIRN